MAVKLVQFATTDLLGFGELDFLKYAKQLHKFSFGSVKSLWTRADVKARKYMNFIFHFEVPRQRRWLARETVWLGVQPGTSCLRVELLSI